MTREDALYLEYLAAEQAEREREYERSIATECACCGRTIHDSPYFDDFGALCFECAMKGNMTTADALKEAARLARGRADYFEKRAGNGSTKHIPAASNEIERARCASDARAFAQAADVIEELAQAAHWP